MGSIHNLLNPLTNTPPQSYVLPRKAAVAEEKGEQDDVVTLDAEAESYAPVEMRATSDDSPIRDEGKEEAQMEQIGPPSTQSGAPGIEQLRQSISQTGAGNSTGSNSNTQAVRGEETASRRTSSSSLTDILNPVEEQLNTSKEISEPVPKLAKASHDPNRSSTPTSTAAEPPQSVGAAKQDTQPTTSANDPEETEDKMVVDIVGLTETDNPMLGNHQQEYAPIHNSEPMKRSLSTDSQRTITDIVEDSPAPADPFPSPPSKKRKFTPESSPDEPLSNEVPTPTPETVSQEPELQNQISVEMPQGLSRANKKPKKAPVRRPQPTKKKVLNGARKPSKPKSKDLGLDDDTPGSSTRQSSLAPSVVSESSYDSTARNSKQLYCICRKPDQGEWMICCESCNDWFHGTCVHLEESDEPLIDTYICPICTELGKGKTTWRRKCRLEGCKNPATAPVKGVKGGAKGTRGSKYCSDEHGKLYFQVKLKELDADTITKEQLKSLVMAVGSVDSFKTLGDEEPIIPESVLLNYKTAEDDSRLADLRLEREKLLRKLEIVYLRQSFLHLAVEKAKKLNSDLKALVPQQLTVGKNKPKIKAKEICGFNEILSLDDAEFLEWSATDEGNRVFAEKWIEGDKECSVEKRRCRHTGWQGLRGEDILMEESLLKSQVEGIARQENVIKERQKVRARCGDPSNGRVIPVN